MDIQLELPAKPDHFIWIESVVARSKHKRGPHAGARLSFSAEHVRYDDASQENIRLKTEAIMPEEFSKWWAKQLAAGWQLVNP